jgi:hypothetical protein
LGTDIVFPQLCESWLGVDKDRFRIAFAKLGIGDPEAGIGPADTHKEE